MTEPWRWVALAMLLCGAALMSEGAESREQGAVHVCEAICRGDTGAVESFLEQGAGPVGAEGPFLLLWAAGRGHERIAELALARGVDPNESTYGVSPLHAAAASGETGIMGLLLRRGARVDACEPSTGDTPLHKAAREGQMESVRLLLQNGADANACNRSGATSLHCAAGLKAAPEDELFHFMELFVRARGRVPPDTYVWPRKGHAGIVELLLSAGARPEARTRYGHTPLHVAAAAGNDHIVSLLLASGAEVDAPDHSGMTALHWAAFRGEKEIARILLDGGADPNRKDGDGWDALHWATLVCADEVAEVLLSSGATLDAFKAAGLGKTAELREILAADGAVLEACDARLGMTPLQWAAWGARPKCVEFLVSQGARIEAQDSYGSKVVHNAAVGGSTQILDLLLARGIDVDAPDKYHQSALFYAAWAGQKEAVDYLLSKGAKMDPLGAGFGALRLAAKGGNCAVVEDLLEHGAAAGSVLPYDGTTPLFSAEFEGQSGAAEVLLGYGADPNAENRDGDTVLHFAAGQGYDGFVRTLLAHGADPNARNKAGATPLHYAADAGRREAARLLLEAGAQINLRCEGRTPLMSAISGGNGEVAILLQEHGATE